MLQNNIILPKSRLITGILAGASALSAYFIYLTLKTYANRRKYRHIPGPKSKGILGFYFGQILDIGHEIAKNDRSFTDLLLEYVEKYGPIIKVQILDQILIITTDPGTLKEMFTNPDFEKNAVMYKRAAYPCGIRFLGHGLVTEINHEKWRPRRALFNPGFHKQALSDNLTEFNSKADLLMEKLRSKADGKSLIVLQREINHATLDIIASVAFGMSIDSINDPNNKFLEHMKYVLKINNDAILDPMYQYKPQNWFTVRKFRNSINYLRNIGKTEILNRIKALKNNEYVPTDILTSILRIKDHELDLEAMIDEFMTFFLAGQETTANALSFCFLELGKSSEILEKARKEVDEVIGSRSDISIEDVNNLKYIGCIFKEVLRLYPTVPIFSRKNKYPVIVNGYAIPARSWMAVSSFISGRYSKSFPNSLKFDPSRFENNENSYSDSGNFSYIYYPFSRGPRNCIGQNFAQIEAKIILAKFIQNFNITLDPTQSFDILENITLMPKSGVKCYLTIRN